MFNLALMSMTVSGVNRGLYPLPVADDDRQLLAAPQWDLAPLVRGQGEGGVDLCLEEAGRRAVAVRLAYRGSIADTPGKALAELFSELEEIEELLGRAETYSELNHAANTISPGPARLLQRVCERASMIRVSLLFVDVELSEMGAEEVGRRIADPYLKRYRRHLERLHERRAHQLDEAAEKLMAELAVTGVDAFVRAFDTELSELKLDLDGFDGSATIAQGLGQLESPERQVRAQGAEAVTVALGRGLGLRSFILDNVIHDKAIRDRARGYGHWLDSRNLDNEVDAASVEGLVEAVVSRYDLVRRWYHLKARLLGLERLCDYDRLAPLAPSRGNVSAGEAQKLVLAAFTDLSPRLGEAAAGFFSGRYVDAASRPGKQGGAFCSYATPATHPYLLLNSVSRPRDVLTMAHELGHGVHACLSRARGVFGFSTPVTIAETAAVLAEILVRARQLRHARDDPERLELLAAGLDAAMATVFRQIALLRFEGRAHQRRRVRGPQSENDFGELWMQTQAEIYGDSVELSSGYECWWSYVPYFVAEPGYAYAYPYGFLLAAAIHRRFLVEGEALADRYLEFLGAGGSMSARELGQILDIDLTDVGIWLSGLDWIEGQLAQAEALV